MRYRAYLVPLQAFAALFLCAGMVWMIVLMAGFNPNPPTALDIRVRSTAEVSFASMNSTAAVLAVQMVSELVPTAIALPLTRVVMITAVPTSTLSFALIPISGPSYTPSPTPFSLLSFLFPPTKSKEPSESQPPTTTNTVAPTPVPTITKTETLVPTPTVPTSTPLPTETDTPVPATATTEPPPTETDTALPPTNTEPPPTPTNEPPTDTLEPPTNEPAATDTPNAAVP